MSNLDLDANKTRNNSLTEEEKVWEVLKIVDCSKWNAYVCLHDNCWDLKKTLKHIHKY
jgi:hypothetical protein